MRRKSGHRGNSRQHFCTHVQTVGLMENSPIDITKVNLRFKQFERGKEGEEMVCEMRARR